MLVSVRVALTHRASFCHAQRIACLAKMGESGGIGFHEFLSSCSVLFAGRVCAAKPDAFSTVRQPCTCCSWFAFIETLILQMCDLSP